MKCTGGVRSFFTTSTSTVNSSPAQTASGAQSTSVSSLLAYSTETLSRPAASSRPPELGRLCGEEQTAALAGHIALAAGAGVGAHGVHRLHVGLVVAQAQVGALLALQRLLALNHLQLAQQGFFHHHHAALVVQSHTALDQEGAVVAGAHAQPADHACPQGQPAEQLALFAHIVLFHFKVADRQQLAVKVAVANHREKIRVSTHGYAPPIVVS